MTSSRSQERCRSWLRKSAAGPRAGKQWNVPLIPRAVMPWLTAFNAYSATRQFGSKALTKPSEACGLLLTNLHQLPAMFCQYCRLEVVIEELIPGRERRQRERVAISHGCGWESSSVRQFAIFQCSRFESGQMYAIASRRRACV